MIPNDLGELSAVELLELIQRIADEVKLRLMEIAGVNEH